MTGLEAFAKGLEDGYSLKAAWYGEGTPFTFENGLVHDYMDGWYFGAKQHNRDFPQLDLREAA